MRVEDRVGDLVANLVGMTFGDGLGRELITCHSGSRSYDDGLEKQCVGVTLCRPLLVSAAAY